MPHDKRKPPARAARTGGPADLKAGGPDESKNESGAAGRHPQGAGGIDVAADAPRRRRRRAKRRLTRVLR